MAHSNCEMLKRTNLVIYGAVILILLVLPRIMNPFIVHVAIYILFYAYLGMSWNILGGYAGQLSLGHSLFFGTGAYTSTLLFMHFGVTPWVGMVLGGILSAAIGMFMGYLCFRYGLKGPYFALATLAFAEVARIIVENASIFNGAQGLLIPSVEYSFSNFRFFSTTPFYYTILSFTLLGSGVCLIIETSKLGSYLFAIREDETAAQSIGIDSRKYKLIAVCISAFLTSLGGTFYAQYVTFISPETSFGITLSIEIILRPIIGGMTSFLGAVLGAFVLGPLSEVTRIFLGKYSGVHLITYGLMLIFIILFMPHGLLVYVADVYNKFGLKGKGLNGLGSVGRRRTVREQAASKLSSRRGTSGDA